MSKNNFKQIKESIKLEQMHKHNKNIANTHKLSWEILMFQE